jgi:hypothetical protein
MHSASALGHSCQLFLAKCLLQLAGKGEERQGHEATAANTTLFALLQGTAGMTPAVLHQAARQQR